jgi:hypothetical protein
VTDAAGLRDAASLERMSTTSDRPVRRRSSTRRVPPRSCRWGKSAGSLAPIARSCPRAMSGRNFVTPDDVRRSRSRAAHRVGCAATCGCDGSLRRTLTGSSPRSRRRRSGDRAHRAQRRFSPRLVASRVAVGGVCWASRTSRARRSGGRSSSSWAASLAERPSCRRHPGRERSLLRARTSWWRSP